MPSPKIASIDENIGPTTVGYASIEQAFKDNAAAAEKAKIEMLKAEAIRPKVVETPMVTKGPEACMRSENPGVLLNGLAKLSLVATAGDKASKTVVGPDQPDRVKNDDQQIAESVKQVLIPGLY